MKAADLQEILDNHKKWLNLEDGGKRADLRFADLQSANLQSANLQNADLRFANLRYADLQNADLRYADLQCAYLQGANLRYADLQYAYLQDANLQNANLQNADLDFSVWQLWCGSFSVKVDRKIFVQLLYHLLCVECDDPAVKKIQGMKKLIKLANEFHRTNCKRIQP